MTPTRRTFVAGFVTASFGAASQAKAALGFLHRNGVAATVAVAPAAPVTSGAVLAPVSYMTNADAGRGSGAAVPALSKTLRGTGWAYGVGTTQNFHDRQSIAPGASFDLSVIPITLDPFNWIDNVQFYATDGTAAGLTSVLIDGTKDTRYRGMSQPQNVNVETATAALASTTTTTNGVTTTSIPLANATRVRMPINAVVSGAGIQSGTAVIGNTANTVILAGTVNVSSGAVLTFTYFDPAFGYVATLKNDGSSATDRHIDVYFTARPNRGYERLCGPYRFLLKGTATDSRTNKRKTVYASNWVGAAGTANGAMHYPGSDTSSDPTNPQTPYLSRLLAVAYAAANGLTDVVYDDLTGVNPTTMTFFGIPYNFKTTYVDDLCWVSKAAESVGLVEVKPQYGTLCGITRSGAVHLDNVPNANQMQNAPFYTYPANRVLDYGAFIPTGALGPKFTAVAAGGPTRSTICILQGLILDTSMSQSFCTTQKYGLNYDGSFVVPNIINEQAFFGFKNCSGAWASGGSNFALNVDLGLTWDFTYTAAGYGPTSRIGQTIRQLGDQYQVSHGTATVNVASVIQDPTNNVVVARIGQSRIAGSRCVITVVKFGASSIRGIVEVYDANGNPIAYDWNFSSNQSGAPVTDNVVFDNGLLAGMASQGYGTGFYILDRPAGNAQNVNYNGYIVKYPGNAFVIYLDGLNVNAGTYSTDSSNNPITFSFRTMIDSQVSIFGTEVDIVTCAANQAACVGGPQNSSNPTIDIDRLGAGIYDMLYTNAGAQRANSFNLVYSSQGNFNLFPNSFTNTLVAVPVTVNGNTVTGVGTTYSPSGTVTIAQDSHGWLMTLGGGATVPSTAQWGSTVTVGSQTCKIARQPDGVVGGKTAVYVVVPSGFTAVTTATAWTYAFNKTGLVAGSRIIIGSTQADVLSVNENVATLVSGSSTLSNTSTPVAFTHQISPTKSQIVFTDLFQDDYGNTIAPRSQGLAANDTMMTGYALHTDVDQEGDGASPMTELPQDNFCEVKGKYICTDAQPYFHQGNVQTPSYYTITTDSTNVGTATGLNTCTVTSSPDNGSTSGGTAYPVYSPDAGATMVPDFVAGLGAKRKFYQLVMSGGNAGYQGWQNGRGNVRLPIVSSAAGYSTSFHVYAATATDGNGNWTAYVFDDMNVLNGGAFNVAVGDKFQMPQSLIDGSSISLAPNNFRGKTDGSGTFCSNPGDCANVPANMSNDIITVTMDPTNPTKIIFSQPPQNYANKTNQQFQHLFSYPNQMRVACVQANYTRYTAPSGQVVGGAIYNTGFVQSSWAVGPYFNGPLGFVVPSMVKFGLNYTLMGTGIYATRPAGYSPSELSESANGQTTGRASVFGSVASSPWQGTLGSINGNTSGAIAIDPVTMKPTAASAANIPTYKQLGLVGPFYAHDPDGNDISGLGANAKVGAYQPLSS